MEESVQSREAPPEKRQCLENGQRPARTEMKKRNDYLQWDEYFMAVAFLSAQRSKDPRSQVNNDYTLCLFAVSLMRVGRIIIKNCN